jgi:hypothetical protein
MRESSGVTEAAGVGEDSSAMQFELYEITMGVETVEMRAEPKQAGEPLSSALC